MTDVLSTEAELKFNQILSDYFPYRRFQVSAKLENPDLEIAVKCYYQENFTPGSRLTRLSLR